MGPFCPNLGKREFSRKICLGQFLAFIGPLTSCTISEKNNERILRKSKKSPFLGPFCPNLDKREFSRKICLGQFLVFIGPLTSCTISEKTNELILRKSKKSPFWGPFFPNLGKREFSRKIGLCHFFTLMNLQLHAKYQKNQMNQFWEKCVTNVRTDGQTWIYRTLRPPDGGPIPSLPLIFAFVIKRLLGLAYD